MKHYPFLQRLFLLNALLSFTVLGWGQGVTTEEDLIAALKEGGTIELAGNITIHSRIAITKDVTILGNEYTIKGEGDCTGFDIKGEKPVYTRTENPKVTFQDLTLANCYGGERGGAIYNQAGILTLDNCTLSGNEARYGGAIFTVTATTNLNFVVLSGNAAVRGGALYAQTSGQIVAENTTIVQNTATDGGGAIFGNLLGEFSLTNVLIAENEAATEGGGIFAQLLSKIELDYVTIANNTSGLEGGGLSIQSQSTCTVDNSIIWNNQSGSAGKFIEDNYDEATIDIDDTNIVGSDTKEGTPLLDEDYIPNSDNEAVLVGFRPGEYIPTNPTNPSVYHSLTLEVAPGIDIHGLTAGTHTVKEGEHLFLQFQPKDPALTAADVMLLIDGVEVSFNDSGAGYYYSYILNPIKQGYSILIALRQYTITLPDIQGMTMTPGPGEWPVAYGQAFTFRLDYDDLYDIDDLKVLANGIPMTPDETGLGFTIGSVTGPITISIEGVENPTSNLHVDESEVKIVMDNRQLRIDNSTGQAVDVVVYSITGKSIVQLRAFQGSRSISLAPGTYIVRAGEIVRKIIINES